MKDYSARFDAQFGSADPSPRSRAHSSSLGRRARRVEAGARRRAPDELVSVPRGGGLRPATPGRQAGDTGTLRATADRARVTRPGTDFSALRGHAAPAQKASLGEYFAHVANLRVAFGQPEITVNGETAAASFLRRDEFQNQGTRQPVRIAAHFVAIPTRTSGAWKIGSLEKPP